MYEDITIQARTVVTELLDQANLKSGALFVVGCSSSEMVGMRIGKGSSMDAAQAAFQGIYPVLQERGRSVALTTRHCSIAAFHCSKLHFLALIAKKPPSSPFWRRASTPILPHLWQVARRLLIPFVK